MTKAYQGHRLALKITKTGYFINLIKGSMKLKNLPEQVV
jgi:hypothetical protein